MNIYVSHIRPLLEYASCVWNTGYLGDLSRLERVQRRWTRSVRGLQETPYDERLKILNLFSFQGRLLRADLILVFKMFHNLCSINPLEFFQLRQDSRTRGHRFKICVPVATIDARKRFFACRVVEWWNGLSADTVEAESIETFKRLLHRDLGDALFAFS